MKFCKRLLLATTAISLTLLLSVAGSAQAQQRCQTDGQERKIHLHLSDPQLPEELVCEVIDESLTLLLSVAGSAQAQQRCQTDGQERKIHLHLSDPQLPEELVCEVIDEFTDRYSEQLAQWTHHGQSVQHQHGRHHSHSGSCQNACQCTDCPTCPNRTECRRIDCVTSHSCTVPQEYEAGWVAFSDAEDDSTGQVKVLCRRCQAPGCNFLEKEWEVNLTK